MCCKESRYTASSVVTRESGAQSHTNSCVNASSIVVTLVADYQSDVELKTDSCVPSYGFQECYHGGEFRNLVPGLLLYSLETRSVNRHWSSRPELVCPICQLCETEGAFLQNHNQIGCGTSSPVLDMGEYSLKCCIFCSQSLFATHLLVTGIHPQSQMDFVLDCSGSCSWFLTVNCFL